MPSTATAKIAARANTDHTGITDEVAGKFADNLGSAGVAIVEFFSEEETIGLDNKRSVKLTLGFIEPANDRETAEHLREFARALYRARNPQQAIDTLSDQEPSIAELRKQGQLLLMDAEIDDNGTITFNFGEGAGEE